MNQTAPSHLTPMRPVWLSALVLATLFVTLLNAVPVASNDLWLQIKLGELTIANGAIPRTLLFPFTPARDFLFTAHEWLPSVVFHAWAHVFGEAGLMPLQALLALGQFALSFMLARRLSGSPALALVMATLAMLTINYRDVLRPEIFALLLFVSLLHVLIAYRDGGRPAVLWWTVPLAIVWANCHGSFLLGPVVAGLFAVGEGLQAALSGSGRTDGGVVRQLWRGGGAYALAAVGMFVATGVNPRGPELWAFAFQLQESVAIKSLIKEWLPTLNPLFVETSAFWIFAIVGVASLGVLVACWRRLTATDLLLFVAFGALALQRNRHIVWFAFVDLLVCADVIGRRGAAFRFENLAAAVALVSALVGVAACVTLGNVRGAFVYDAPSNNFLPVMTAELADPKLSGNVFNSYELGSELIYRDWPRLKPSIDSRVDSYGDAYFLDQVRLLTDEPRLQAFLTAYGVNDMLLLRRDFAAGIARMPAIRAAWHVRLADAKMVLLERNVPLPARDAARPIAAAASSAP